MAWRPLACLLLVLTITPNLLVESNLVAKPRQMVVNIVYDFDDDGGAGSSNHTEVPTAAPTGTTPPETSTTTTSPITTASNTATTSTATTTTSASSTTPDNGEFHCTSKGTFADPKDCKSFYRCNNDLVASHDKCMFGLGHFDPNSQGCVFGSDC